MFTVHSFSFVLLALKQLLGTFFSLDLLPYWLEAIAIRLETFCPIIVLFRGKNVRLKRTVHSHSAHEKALPTLLQAALIVSAVFFLWLLHCLILDSKGNIEDWRKGRKGR